MSTTKAEITISGVNLELIKKDIRHLYLKISPPHGKVSVVCPEKISDEELRLFVLSHKAWIANEQKAYQNQPRQTEREYVNGESVYVWNRQYRLEIVPSQKNEVRISGKKLYLHCRKESTPKQRETILYEWYRAELKKVIPDLIRKWEPIIGVNVKDFGIKNMRTRWGTCSQSSGKIWLNLQLAKKPLASLEYVVVHEMIHFKERKHNTAFREELTRCLPFWQDTRKELNACLLEYMEE